MNDTPTPTPETDATETTGDRMQFCNVVSADFARSLERRLIEVKKQRDRMTGSRDRLRDELGWTHRQLAETRAQNAAMAGNYPQRYVDALNAEIRKLKGECTAERELADRLGEALDTAHRQWRGYAESDRTDEDLQNATHAEARMYQHGEIALAEWREARK